MATKSNCVTSRHLTSPVKILHVGTLRLISMPVRGLCYAQVRATRVGRDTALAQIVRLVEAAQMAKAPIQAFADYVSSIFVPVVVVLAAITTCCWCACNARCMCTLPLALLGVERRWSMWQLRCDMCSC